jgi:hypothetical protein
MRFGVFTSLTGTSWSEVLEFWRVFIPTMFRPLADLRRDMDRFFSEIVPEFR